MSDQPGAASVLASLPVALLTIAPGGRIAEANPAAEQLIGMSARRLVGRDAETLLARDNAGLLRRMLSDEATMSAHGIALGIDGRSERRFDLMLAPVADSEGWRLLALFDTASGQALLSAGAPPGSAITLRAPEILAHEIKNPLAAIRAAAQLLGRRLDDGQQPMVKLIADEVDRIARLIDQMQSLSSRTAPVLQPCNLHEALGQAKAIAVASVGEGVQIVEEYDPSIPHVLGSFDGLVRILLNLLTNAIEACGQGQAPRIMLKTRYAMGIKLRRAGDGEAIDLPVELRISDNGPGIDPAIRDHLFEPFVTGRKNGQGLGLALVQKLVRDMNGRIAVERDEVEGLTHFRLNLPVAAAEAVAA